MQEVDTVDGNPVLTNVFTWRNYINRTETATATAGPNGQAVLASAIQGTTQACDTLTAGVNTGEYTCTINTDVTNITTPAAVAWEPTLTHRVAVLFGSHLPAGQYPGNGWADFIPADLGSGFAAAKSAVVNTRDIATVDSCNECHGKLSGHGGDRVTVAICVTCHNPGTTDANSGNVVDLPTMIHKIHAGEHLTQEYTIWGYRDTAHSYNEVTFPGDLKNCAKCHTSEDTATPDGDAWKTVPTIAACGACHDDVNFATGANHPGGIQADNAACKFCHAPAAIAGYHDTTLTGKDAAEFQVNISMTPPANGTNYVAGEAPVVTVTLKDAAGADVDPTVYTAAKDAKGVSGGGLSAASLYVYGPRAKAKPVLTTGSSTDPNLAADAEPTQGHNLLIPSTDPLVSADANGFHYQLQAIPADLPAGTYMVRFEGADYGGVSNDDYVTSSVALINFQVGTATPEKKVAGDGCLNCHGDNRMHLAGAHAHNIPFDTDYCLACHDQSNNHGVPIANRVHAVHAANSDGDLYGPLYTYEASPGPRDWSDITYPQNVQHCQTCHNSGNSSYTTKPYEAPCAGCHIQAGNGVLDHMQQNGAPY